MNNFKDRKDKDELMSIGANSLVDYINRCTKTSNIYTFYRFVESYITNRLNKYIKYDEKIVSLDELIEEESDSIINFNPEFKIDIEKQLLDKTLVKNLFSYLSEKEKNILTMHYIENMTFDEIGIKYNISRQRVYQIMDFILRKMLDCYNIYR